MVAICISIELYESVQLRSGDSEALPLTLLLTVGVVGLTLRGAGGGRVRLLGQIFIKKKEPNLAKKSDYSLIRSNTVCIVISYAE